jgi:hypothetical protein
MLAGDLAVVIDQVVHGLRQRDDLRGALHLDPLTEEAVGEGADGHLGVSAGVVGLGRRLSGADDDPAFVVHACQHRRHLGAAVGMLGQQDGAMVAGEEVPRLV